MLRITLMSLALLSAPLLAQPGDSTAGLVGRVEGRMYISPTGMFRVPIPVLPELGGSLTDTPNVVTFQDNFNVNISIGVFTQDASQRWELSTRGLKDYLGYFLGTFMMPDFQSAFPGCRIESAIFSPSTMGGALIAYTLLPGGSMFENKRTILGAAETPAVAKRGNMIFVHNGAIIVITTELAERVTERTSYKRTTAEEDQLLRDRLVDLAKKIEWVRPAATP